jgi:hypothetical protein
MRHILGLRYPPKCHVISIFSGSGVYSKAALTASCASRVWFSMATFNDCYAWCAQDTLSAFMHSRTRQPSTMESPSIPPSHHHSFLTDMPLPAARQRHQPHIARHPVVGSRHAVDAGADLHGDRRQHPRAYNAQTAHPKRRTARDVDVQGGAEQLQHAGRGRDGGSSDGSDLEEPLAGMPAGNIHLCHTKLHF